MRQTFKFLFCRYLSFPPLQKLWLLCFNQWCAVHGVLGLFYSIKWFRKLFRLKCVGCMREINVLQIFPLVVDFIRTSSINITHPPTNCSHLLTHPQTRHLLPSTSLTHPPTVVTSWLTHKRITSFHQHHSPTNSSHLLPSTSLSHKLQSPPSINITLPQTRVTSFHQHHSPTNSSHLLPSTSLTHQLQSPPPINITHPQTPVTSFHQHHSPTNSSHLLPSTSLTHKLTTPLHLPLSVATNSPHRCTYRCL
jgi:hypothetical protein